MNDLDKNDIVRTKRSGQKGQDKKRSDIFSGNVSSFSTHMALDGQGVFQMRRILMWCEILLHT